MKRIILLIILILSFMILSCDAGETSDGTHNQAKPIFMVETLGSPSGYASETSPLEMTFIVDESTIEGDTPYQFIWDFGDGSDILKSNDLEQLYSYTKQGIYTVKVTLQDNDYVSDDETPDEAYTKELTILAKSKVDFAIQVGQVNKILFEKEDDGKITVNVVNLGNEAASDSIKLKAFLSSDQNLGEGDLELGEAIISTLAEGESSEVNIDFIIPSTIEPGNYYIITKIDYDNIYIENNEGNNTFILNSQIEILGGTGRSPDLAFETVELPSFFIVNDFFNLNLGIINLGETASLPFSYKLILSKNDVLEEVGDENSDDLILKYDYVSDSILADDVLPIEIESSISSEGEYYLFIVLDPTDDVKESNEDNNIYRTEKITVGQTLSGVDLIPFNTIINPLTNITRGKTLSVTYSVKNRGDRPALKSNTRILISQNETIDENDIILDLENGDLGELEPIGSNLTIEKIHRVKVPDDLTFPLGEYYILIDINYLVDGEESRLIEEAEYNNNLASSRKITIEEGTGECSRDIIIENLEILPSPAFEGSPFTLRFDISNSGTADITSFVTKVYSGEQGVDIDTESMLRKNYNISRLTAGSTLTKEIILEVPNNISGDKFCVLVKADETNIVGECDEENNIINFCFDITVRGNDNDIVTSNVLVSKNNIDLSEVEQMNVDFTVKNIGTTNTATFYCSAYFSPDGEFSKTNDFKVSENYTIYNILGGTEQEVSGYEITVPKNMGDRSYNLFINCDDTKLVPENDENNNYSLLSEKVIIKGSTSGCNADNYEQNDTMLTASLLNPIENVYSKLCDQDVDWYYFTLNKTHKFRIDLEQGLSDKDIDLVLYKKESDDSLTEILVSETTSKDVIEMNVLMDEDEGEYYLKVFPKNYLNMTQTDYSLTVSYEEVGGEGVDLFLKDVEEEISNIITNEPFTLKFKVENLRNTASGSFDTAIYISEDRVISSDDEILRIIESTTLDLLETYDFQEELTLTENLPSGQYFLILKTDPYDTITEVREDNNTYIKEIMVNYTSSCELDALEPNTWEPYLPKVISNASYANLKLCGDDYDVYLLYMKSGTTIDVEINFIDMDGDIEMKLYKPNDTTGTNYVASSTSSNDVESFSYSATESGFFILKIYYWGSHDDAQTYSMTVSGITDGYNFINSKLDIESEYLETGENIFVRYEIESESTKVLNRPIDYKIYLSENPTIDDSDSIIYHEVIESLSIGEKINKRVKASLPANLNTANYYFISKIDTEASVSELNENDNVKIKVATVSGLCQRDNFESNNDIAEAEDNDSFLTTATYNNLTICPTDKDFYGLGLEAGTDLFINLYFENTVGDLDLRLYDNQGFTVMESSSITNNESIQYHVENGGVYYVRVWGAESVTSNAYSLEILQPSCDNVICNNGSCEITDLGQTACACDTGYIGDACDTCDTGFTDNGSGVCIAD